MYSRVFAEKKTSKFPRTFLEFSPGQIALNNPWWKKLELHTWINKRRFRWNPEILMKSRDFDEIPRFCRKRNFEISSDIPLFFTKANIPTLVKINWNYLSDLKEHYIEEIPRNVWIFLIIPEIIAQDSKPLNPPSSKSWNYKNEG